MQKTVTGIIILFLLVPATAISQDGTQERQVPTFWYNEETGEFQNYPETPESVDSLLNLGVFYRNSDSRKSLFAADAALALAREIGYREGEALAHNLAGIKYSDFGDYDLALDHYLQATEIYEQLGNRQLMSQLINNRAIIHMELENYELAQEYLAESMQMREELGLNDLMHYQINNMGVIHRRQGEYDQALEYFFEAQQLAVESASDSLMHMVATLNIGNTFRNKGQLEESEGYLFRAADYFERVDDKNYLSAALHTLGRLYLDRGEYSTAMEHAEAGLRLAEEEGLRDRMRTSNELLAEIHEHSGNFEEAYRYYQAYHAIHDTLLNIQRSEQINRMRLQFEVEQKDRRIQLLNNESALQDVEIAQERLWVNFLLTGLGLCAVIVGLLYKYNHQKKQANVLLEQKNREINQQNEKLIRLNQEKDEFLGMAAHDLRTPLSGISSCVSMIKDTGDMSDEEARQYFELIEMAVDRMVALINNLLDINSIEDGREKMETVPVGLERPIERVVVNYREVASKKDIEVSVRMDPGQQPVLADEETFRRILENLLSNAIKFSPPGAKVEVSTRMNESSVEIIVSDNGPGIPEEEQNRLFQRFSRLSTKPTGNESSVGLGLFIVRKLTEAMNGTVRCVSRPGEGTSFILSFPMAGTEKIYS